MQERESTREARTAGSSCLQGADKLEGQEAESKGNWVGTRHLPCEVQARRRAENPPVGECQEGSERGEKRTRRDGKETFPDRGGACTKEQGTAMFILATEWYSEGQSRMEGNAGGWGQWLTGHELPAVFCRL